MRKKVTKNLLKDSKAYYEDNDYYEMFSKAEDGEGKVLSYLIGKATGGIVLDAGCGTGKFLKVLENGSDKYIGVDLSFEQLVKAKAKSEKENSIFINANLADLMIGNNSVDLVVSPWVLGTVLDLNERSMCLEELKRVLKPGGEILLIENDIGSEFEYIRGRDKDSRTADYNKWIMDNGFEVAEKIDTYFKFDSREEAYNCFSKIYGEAVADRINGEKIGHRIVIFKYVK